MSLTHRKQCPACNNKTKKNQKTIFSCSYDKEPIKSYMEEFYKEKGEYDSSLLSKETYEIIECSNCGLVYQKNIPDDTLCDAIYNKFISSEYEKKLIEDKETAAQFRMYSNELLSLVNLVLDRKRKELLNNKNELTQEQLESELSNIKPSNLKILDYGMGYAKWAKILKAMGCDVYGLEITPEKIKLAKSYGIKVLSYEDINGDKYNNYFDIIHTEQVFEHLNEPNETLKLLSKLLKNDNSSIIKISVPPIRKTNTKLKQQKDKFFNINKQKQVMPISPLEHINCFTKKSLLELAKNNNLKEVKMPLGVLSLKLFNLFVLVPLLPVFIGIKIGLKITNKIVIKISILEKILNKIITKKQREILIHRLNIQSQKAKDEIKLIAKPFYRRFVRENGYLVLGRDRNEFKK